MDERRDEPELRAAFDRAVEKAAEIAAQSVAKIHRRRVVTQTAVVTAIVLTAILIPVAWKLRDDAVSQAHSNALYNCRLFGKAAATIADFVSSDVKLRLAQNSTGLTGQVVKGLSKILSVKVIERAQAQNLAYLMAAVAQWNKDGAKLTALARPDCVAHLSH